MTNVVICQACKNRLYTCSAVGREFAGAEMRPEDLTPLEEDIKQPEFGDPMVCPKCGSFPYHSAHPGRSAVVLELEDGSFWPYPPQQLFATRGSQNP